MTEQEQKSAKRSCINGGDYTQLLRRGREILAVEVSLQEMLLQEKELCNTRSVWEKKIKQNNKANELLQK